MDSRLVSFPHYLSPLGCAWKDMVLKIKQFSWLCQITFVVNSSLIKSSILLSYLRIAPNKGFRYSVYGSLFVVVSYAFGVGTAVVFTCRYLSSHTFSIYYPHT